LKTFSARDGQFWLDDQPQLIQAGEFHYFRTPADQWAQRLGLLQGAGFNTVATYIPWLWHQVDEDSTDLDGHTHPLRNLAGFLDLAAEMGFLIIPRPGPYIMAETINEGIPPWVFSHYPQVAFISQDERVQNLASYLHPDFLACVRKWYEAVFAVLVPRQVTRGGQIIMWQLDNEMGMAQWVRNIFDVNPDTIARFATYLRHTYGDELAARYPTGDLPAFLREEIVHPALPHAANIVADYRHFYREYLREYAGFLWAEAKSLGMEVPPVTNIHGFSNGKGGRTFPIGLSQLIKVIEMPGMISATDVYPLHIDEGNFHQLLLVNETTRALQNKEQALFSIEFQSGGNNDFSGQQTSLYDLHSRLCISVGMRAINHYSFCAGENDPILSPIRRHDWGPPVRNDGTVRRHYPRYRQLCQVLSAYGDDLIMSQPKTVATVGFLLDHFMTEVDNAFTQGATRIIAHQRECILFDQIARGLALTHRPFNAVELVRAGLSVSQISHLWVMIDKQCPAAVQQKLVDYVRQGGKLILIGRMCVEDFAGRQCTILQEALGIEAIESDGRPFAEKTIGVLGYPYVPARFLESYQGTFDRIFATRPNGETVGFTTRLGDGEVMMFGAALPANTLDDLDVFHRMASLIGCQPLFEVADWVDVRASRGANGSFLFVNNYQDDPVATTIRLGDEMLFGENPVSLPARRGLILPLEWQLDDGVLVHYTTGEVTDVCEEERTITLQLEPADFTAELTLTSYHCAEAEVIHQKGDTTRVLVRRHDGRIVLRKENAEPS
jgi:beta-galactosidase